MADKTYLYRVVSPTPGLLAPYLAIGTTVTVGTPLTSVLLPVTIDETQKQDLDEAMLLLGYVFVSEYTDVNPLATSVDYGVFPVDPTIPPPTDGATYYNSALKLEMSYDISRLKWLSSGTSQFFAGRNGNVAAGSFYRGIDGLAQSATSGYTAHYNGTVVSLAYTRADVDAATFQVTANGVTIASLASSAVSGRTTTLNADFTAGQVLAVRNAAGGNTTTDAQVWVRVKWRF